MNLSKHPFQLRKIELQDFKSVRSASVELRPLSVIVGANSSGKSTLLQSILAVTQAVRSDTSTGEFPLNGEFVKLGTFEETRNFLSSESSSPMKIGVVVVGPRNPPPSRITRRWNQRKLEVGWRAYLDRDDVNDSGFARIVQLELDIRDPASNRTDEGIRLLTCDFAAISREAPGGEDLPRVSRQRGMVPASSPMVSVDGRLRVWKGQGNKSQPIQAASLHGGVPREVFSRQTAQFVYSDLWWSAAQQALDEVIRDEETRELNTRMDSPNLSTVRRRNLRAINEAERDILEFLERPLEGPDGNAADVDSGEPYANDPRFFFYQRLAQLLDKDKKLIARSLAQIGFDDFVAALDKKLGGYPWANDEMLVEPSGLAGTLLRQTGLLTQRFFRSQVRYLGPLREAPHVLYDPGPSKLDLGPKGEYAAAVLHAQAGTMISMPTEGGGQEERRLEDALNYWLERFGLVRAAKSKDQARIGIGLNVTPIYGDQSVDLTSVGVGVSQALPVILLCLLAGPGTLVMIEQPELHLHPQLQQDLADFFLACAKSGRQLLIETHSEHLVNRLRTRIAGDRTDETRQLVQLLFAEQTNGITAYRESEVNPYGGLNDDWPEGFLDLGALEAQHLVRLSLAKRSDEAKGPSGS